MSKHKDSFQNSSSDVRLSLGNSPKQEETPNDEESLTIEELTKEFGEVANQVAEQLTQAIEQGTHTSEEAAEALAHATAKANQPTEEEMAEEFGSVANINFHIDEEGNIGLSFNVDDFEKFSLLMATLSVKTEEIMWEGVATKMLEAGYIEQFSALQGMVLQNKNKLEDSDVSVSAERYDDPDDQINPLQYNL